MAPTGVNKPFKGPIKESIERIHDLDSVSNDGSLSLRAVSCNNAAVIRTAKCGENDHVNDDETSKTELETQVEYFGDGKLLEDFY